MTFVTPVLKVLGALLTYPDEVLQESVPEFRQLVDASAIPSSTKARVCALLDYLQTTNLWDLQESYVALFDTGRATSLHLFEHVHGESRDRGQAMVDLRGEYEAVGLQLLPEELPDYIPAFLEFCSVTTQESATEFLTDCSEILRVLDTRLQERQSLYAAVFEAVVSFASNQRKSKLPEVLPEESLDEQWAEQPAFSQGVC
ncbi:MAG: nitrate reductase molybdenum cofactor assembly chaperone [Spirochaetales bacterium]|nr:nitrate reductase molybdenum cofactor assembly chaperone [Spirochaetales bacterium]